MRNALSYVPRRQQSMVLAALRQAFIQPDRAAASQTLRHVVDQLRVKWPKLGAFIDDSEADVLAHMDFPVRHRTKVHSTNPLRRLTKEVKRRADVVGIFPNEGALVRLLGAVLLQANDEWQLQHRYMQTEATADLTLPLTGAVPNQISTLQRHPRPPQLHRTFHHIAGHDSQKLIACRVHLWQPTNLTRPGMQEFQQSKRRISDSCKESVMRTTVIQMNPGQDKALNIEQASQLMRAACKNTPPSILALPEMWTCLGGTQAVRQRAAEALPLRGSNAVGGVAYEFMRSVAREYAIYVHGGSMAELAEGRLYNTTVVFDPSAREVARYRKMHLFDVSTPDGTGYRESANFGSGTEVVTYAAGGMRVGCAICYDLRFPELFLELRKAGAEVVFLPSAFTVQTGKDHWEVLLRARAIETQCWIAAPATWGEHWDGSANVRRHTYGHSLACDPWGNVLGQMAGGTGWVTVHIDRKVTEKIRRDMLLLDHRRVG